MTDWLGLALQRQVEAWQSKGFGFPRVGCNEDVDPFIWVGEPDEDQWCAWRPVPKAGAAPLAGALGELEVHPSVHDYFDNWWFLALDGSVGDAVVSFQPNEPGLEPERWVAQTRGYVRGHDNRLDHCPLGVENTGLLLVVDNRTGELSIEDWERNSFEKIADLLDDAFRRMEF